MVCVREACCKFLLRQLHPSNCLGIRSFADTHACKDLYKKSHKFALQNFEDVIQTEEFLLLPLQEVKSPFRNFKSFNVTFAHIMQVYLYLKVEELISSDNLNVSLEEKVFVSVVAWIKHDIEKRGEYVTRVGKVHSFN